MNERDYTTTLIALCENCDTEVKIDKDMKYCPYCGKELFEKESEQVKPVWSADGMCLLSGFEEMQDKRENYETSTNIDEEVYEIFKTKERAELERDRRECEYIMKKMACESREDNDWRYTDKFPVDCIFYDYLNDAFDGHGDEMFSEGLQSLINFNQIYFYNNFPLISDGEEDCYTTKCIDYLQEKYGEERLKEIWGIK